MFTQSRIQNPVKHLKAEKCKKMIKNRKQIRDRLQISY